MLKVFYMTAKIVEKKVGSNEILNNMEEGDKMNGEFTVVKENEGIPIVAERDGETFYTINYILELMQNYSNYSFNNKNGNISIILFEDGTTLIGDIPYTLHKGIIFISKVYYEETILPLIK